MELKPIDRTDRAKARLNAALSIYRETILPEAQNPERQILYWIEHSKENLADEFKCFAIQSADRVVGYLQYSFFREENVLFFEYLCIKGDSRRRGLIPSKATKSLEAYLVDNYPPDFTMVLEVAHKRDTAGEWQQDKKLLDYFTRLGFRRLHFAYRYPVLQSYDGGLSYPADLMVLLPQRRTNISSSEMRTLLRCLYFKHYLRWDRPFLDATRLSERERLIDALYSQEVAQIGKDDTFGTSGDDKRPLVNLFTNRQPRIRALLDQIFGPKFPRIVGVMVMLFVAQKLLGSPWLLIPFILAVAAVFCLAEDTESSRKLLVVILSRMRPVRTRSS